MSVDGLESGAWRTPALAHREPAHREPAHREPAPNDGGVGSLSDEPASVAVPVGASGRALALPARRAGSA